MCCIRAIHRTAAVNQQTDSSRTKGFSPPVIYSQIRFFPFLKIAADVVVNNAHVPQCHFKETFRSLGCFDDVVRVFLFCPVPELCWETRSLRWFLSGFQSSLPHQHVVFTAPPSSGTPAKTCAPSPATSVTSMHQVNSLTAIICC